MLKKRIALALMVFAIGSALIMGAAATYAAFRGASSSVESLIIANLETASSLPSLRVEAMSSTTKMFASSFSGDFFKPSVTDILIEVQRTNNEYSMGASQLLRQEVDNTAWVDGIVVVEKDGTVLASSFPYLSTRYINVEQYDFSKLEEGTYISPLLSPKLLVDFPWDTPKIAVATDVPNSGGMRVIAYGNNALMETTIIQGTLNAAELLFFDSNFSTNSTKPQSDAEEYIKTEGGKALLAKLRERVEILSSSGDSSISTFRHGPYRVFVKYLPDSKTTAVAMFNEIAFIKRTAILSWPSILSLFIIIAIAVIGSLKLTKMMFAPFEQVVMPDILSAASGDVGQKINYESNSEIGVLARVYNELRTELAHKERELKESITRFSLVMEQKEDIIFEWDAETDLIVFADSFVKRFGYTPARYNASKSNTEPIRTHPNDEEEAKKFFSQIFSQVESTRAVFRVRRADGVYYWVDARSRALYDDVGKFYGSIGVLTDIHDLKSEELRLAERIRIDALSGVYSRQAFEAYARELFGSCKVSCSVEGESPEDQDDRILALVFLDLDRFKDFNTQKGHAYGDRVIRYFGEVLNSVVGPYGIAGRLGGDEFGLALDLKPGEPSPQDIMRTLTERLKLGMQSRKGESATIITASMGLAICPTDGCTYEDLLQHADLEMLSLKRMAREKESIRMLRMLEEEGTQEPT